MRISDYDRQEFAQALRELADGNGGELLDHVKCLRVDEVGDYTLFGIGAVLAMDEAGGCDAEDASGYLGALADIVERPTCRMTECGINHGSCSWGMSCSACGAEFEHVKPSYGWAYCPKCGRKVVENGVD